MTESTLNEYIHVNLINQHSGLTYIQYEPVENLPVGTILGQIHFESKVKRKPIDISGALIPCGNTMVGKIIAQSPLVRQAHYNPHNGVINLVWTKKPEDHFLRLCYTFGDNIEKLLNPVPPIFNWKQEGF